MITKVAITLIVFVVVYIYLLAIIERRIERKNFNNNFKKYNNGDSTRLQDRKRNT